MIFSSIQVKGQYDEYKNSDFYKLLGVEKTSSQDEIKKVNQNFVHKYP